LFYYICTNFHQINIIISSSEILISLWLYKKQINFLLWVHLFHFFIVRSLIKYLDYYFRSVFTLFFIFYDKSIFYLLNISLNLLERESLRSIEKLSLSYQFENCFYDIRFSLSRWINLINHITEYHSIREQHDSTEWTMHI